MIESIEPWLPTFETTLNGIGLTCIVLAISLHVFRSRSVIPLVSVAAVCFVFGNLAKFSKFSIFGFNAELKSLVQSQVRQQVSTTLDVTLSKVIDNESVRTVAAQQYTVLSAFCEPGYKATGISLKSLSDQGTPVLINLSTVEKSGLQGYSAEIQNGGGNQRPPSPMQLQAVCLGLR